MTNLYKDLARAQAIASVVKAERLETLWAAYENACREQDTEQTAELARRIRNKLLDGTDKEMALDRLEVDASTASKLVASLAGILTGEWAAYRQQLRDLPAQDGFPCNIRWPEKPAGKGGAG